MRYIFLAWGYVKWATGSLRPGGATYYYLVGGEIRRIRFWGRWSNETSLDHYIQKAMSA